jgi:2-C-methyl-D-erythritol 4-phosphate cytidylyltransferase
MRVIPFFFAAILALSPAAALIAKWDCKRASFRRSCGREDQVGVILLAGGVGKRMNSSTPKQLLMLHNKTMLERSLSVFLSIATVSSVVVVLDKMYRHHLQHVSDARVTWADPGAERQVSVMNGLVMLNETHSIVCVHDAARPLVTTDEALRCIHEGITHGAATLAVPVKATIKESIDGIFVHRTLDRARLWDIQTPQVARRENLLRGFEKVAAEGLQVTDDVSVIEALGLPVKLCRGEYTNIKITTPEDIAVAEEILRRRECHTHPSYTYPDKQMVGL